MGEERSVKLENRPRDFSEPRDISLWSRDFSIHDFSIFVSISVEMEQVLINSPPSVKDFFEEAEAGSGAAAAIFGNLFHWENLFDIGSATYYICFYSAEDWKIKIKKVQTPKQS